ncbi:PilZ domain-containing protein [Hoeflea prorocentri]|uniref:PilZ domain-containing protein n=1 Tax=Hoeflea prorocentri TaxID=1922333 RepID=A0A9X3ZGZ2_9HYPH|nr:PilZ domain-containing protein [Hoeflea prorocentri]MCY6380398.1 PilZ domain-containing protein [Hoeflea prorocentri]MDA5398198.1 PilZ domain-containing protein [Hoeflea prorocentri]
MHFARGSAQSIAMEPDEDTAYQNVVVNLHGRLMCADFTEYECVAVEMSPGEVQFKCAALPRLEERIVSYIDHIGRIEGKVTELLDDGFRMAVSAPDRKRQKLAAQLTWFANRNELGLPEDRRHERIVPRNPNAEIRLADGDTYPCRIVDLSMSGAALELEIRPEMGTQVILGTMRARVVRHFDDGIAIEFATIQPPESLENFI